MWKQTLFRQTFTDKLFKIVFFKKLIKVYLVYLLLTSRGN